MFQHAINLPLNLQILLIIISYRNFNHIYLLMIKHILKLFNSEVYAIYNFKIVLIFQILIRSYYRANLMNGKFLNNILLF
jgi:hypothetical protein